MTFKEEFEHLKKQKKFNDDKVLLDFFDKLPTVKVDEILSPWQGGDFDTGHWASQSLIDIRWFGKWYKDKMDAIPLLCKDKKGNLYSEKELMNGEATLWEVEFRGKTSATMFYDGSPVFDHFRKVDDNTLFGIMNGKDIEGKPSVVANGRYYFFYLERLNTLPTVFTDTPDL